MSTAQHTPGRWNSVFRTFEVIDPKALTDSAASKRANAEKAELSRKRRAAIAKATGSAA